MSVKITDEMVERASATAFDGGWCIKRAAAVPMRQILEAALNPKPAEPDQEHCWHSWCNLVLTGPFAGQRIRRCIHCQKTESTKPSACEHSWGGSTMHGDEVCCKCGDRRAPVAKPAEPEIPVSYNMHQAMADVFATQVYGPNKACKPEEFFALPDAYRAAEAQRRKEECAEKNWHWKPDGWKGWYGP